MIKIIISLAKKDFDTDVVKAFQKAVGFYPNAILSVIDARKKRFYLSMKKGGEYIIADRDGDENDVLPYLKNEKEPVLVTGPDALLFAEKIAKVDDAIPLRIDAEAPRNLSKALIALGLEKYRMKGADDIGEGPVYIRRSDAEEALEKKIMERKQSGM